MFTFAFRLEEGPMTSFYLPVNNFTFIFPGKMRGQPLDSPHDDGPAIRTQFFCVAISMSFAEKYPPIVLTIDCIDTNPTVISVTSPL